MLNKLAIPLSLVALLAIGAFRSNPAKSEDAVSYHLDVLEIVEAIPIDFNRWVGEEIDLPDSATSLLKPNALVARRYVHRDRAVSVTLMIVQCRDARDMAGHFPPVCYPANGWLTDDDEPKAGLIGGHEAAVYEFHRFAGSDERELTVYNMFVLPTGETSVDMDDVYRLSADYQYRHFGAAQIQILIDGTVDPEDHAWLLGEMHSVVERSIRRVLQGGDQDREEGGS